MDTELYGGMERVGNAKEHFVGMRLSVAVIAYSYP